jgi:hypothetical protein
MMKAFLLVVLATALPQQNAASFSDRVRVGSMKTLGETSGLAYSRKSQNILWAHNDSGDSNRIYAVNTAGDLVATVRVDGSNARDWEDMCIGPGPGGDTHLYVGDIGDNNFQYATKTIYRFPEPSLGNSPFSVSTARIEYRYPDGQHNAEALMIDPQTRDLYIVTKTGSNTGVYVLRYPQNTSGVTTAEKVGTLGLSTITGGDISPSGSEILLKNYGEIFYWSRSGGESIMSALSRSPTRVKYGGEKQGEAIAWSSSGNGFYTASEGQNEPIYYYRKN